MAAISCKGGSGRVDFDDRRKLYARVASIKEMAAGWTVFSIVATNLDPDKLSASNMTQSTDYKVWGKKELERLWHATTAYQIDGLLWGLPVVVSPYNDG